MTRFSCAFCGDVCPPDAPSFEDGGRCCSLQCRLQWVGAEHARNNARIDRNDRRLKIGVVLGLIVAAVAGWLLS